jgi:urease accessory protein
LITRNIRFSSKINVLIVAFFAFFHGFAHGQEISTSASLISYTLGFMLATLLLHGAGILVAKLVVLAFTCLLTVLFSSSALAKSAESVIDIKDNTPVINHYQDSAISAYFGLTPQQRSDQVDSVDFNGNRVTFNDLTRLDVGGGGVLSAISQFAMQPTAMLEEKIISQQQKQSVAGDYSVLMVKQGLLKACENSIKSNFYPSYSSDCSNLDFNNYYPKINHTPGRHFLSNGVGLTSPPHVYSPFAVSRQFQIPRFSLIEASNLQLCSARFSVGNSVIKSFHLLNRYDLSFAISIAGLQLVPNISQADDVNSQSSFATGNINNLYCLSDISKIPLFAEIFSAEQYFFLSKHKSNQLVCLIKIII